MSFRDKLKTLTSYWYYTKEETDNLLEDMLDEAIESEKRNLSIHFYTTTLKEEGGVNFTVKLYDLEDNLIKSCVTDSAGECTLREIPDGDYYFKVFDSYGDDYFISDTDDVGKMYIKVEYGVTSFDICDYGTPQVTHQEEI